MSTPLIIVSGERQYLASSFSHVFEGYLAIVPFQVSDSNPFSPVDTLMRFSPTRGVSLQVIQYGELIVWPLFALYGNSHTEMLRQKIPFSGPEQGL